MEFSFESFDADTSEQIHSFNEISNYPSTPLINLSLDDTRPSNDSNQYSRKYF